MRRTTHKSERRSRWTGTSPTGIAPSSSRSDRGFTLIELLVSIAIIVVLVSLLLPAIRGAVSVARSQRCQAGQRSVAFDFSIFADDALHLGRGSDSTSRTFSMASFQDAQYQIGDFWGWSGQDEVQISDSNDGDALRCPEVSGPLTLSRGRSATQGGVAPIDRVSYGFNIRLSLAEVVDTSGNYRYPQIRLTSGVLQHSNVPLMMDVNGAIAAERGIAPFFIGPTLGTQDIYRSNRYWFPGLKHHGKGNFAFIDGHVAESSHPLEEIGWDWGYTPPGR